MPPRSGYSYGPQPGSKDRRLYEKANIGGVMSPTGRKIYSSGVAVGPAGTGTPYRPPLKLGADYYISNLTGQVRAPFDPNAPVDTAPFGDLGRTGGGGGGGGGGGPDPAKIRGLADSLFNLNKGPYDQMRAAVQNQRTQAQGYNPNFGQMEQEFLAKNTAIDAERAAAVQARLDSLAGFGGQLSQQAGQGLATGVRDLAGQGFNSTGLQQQAVTAAADRTQGLGNMGQYLTALAASGANSSADYRRGSALTTQGAQAGLANNRNLLLNQLQEKDANIALQQAQAAQQLEQARREFMLKYGVE